MSEKACGSCGLTIGCRGCGTCHACDRRSLAGRTRAPDLVSSGRLPRNGGGGWAFPPPPTDAQMILADSVFPPSIQILQAAVTLLAGAAAGVWAIIKVRKRREHAPRLEFTVDVNFVGTHGDSWLVELVALVHNKGLVRHLIREFSFDLRALHQDDPVRYGTDKINYQTEILHLLKEGSWVPKGWEGTFIEPGLQTRYSYVAHLPISVRFVLLHGKFDYEGVDDFHTADRLVNVPAAPGASSNSSVPP